MDAMDAMDRDEVGEEVVERILSMSSTASSSVTDLMESGDTDEERHEPFGEAGCPIVR